MQTIKNAAVYSAELPNAEALAEQLSQRLFTPVLSTHFSSTGFVANEITKQLVTAIPGGYSFIVRRDEKIIPQDEINKWCNIRLKAIELREDRKPTKPEKDAVRAAVIAELAERAFCKNKYVFCYYHEADQRLYLDTASGDLADICLGLLVHTLGKLQTSTIHLSDLRHGLTTRLRAYIDETDDNKGTSFGKLQIGEEVHLKRDGSNEQFVAKGIDVRTSEELRKALDNGCIIDAIRFEDGAMSVKLTKDFKLQSIKWVQPEPMETDDVSDEVHEWTTDAGLQLGVLNGFVSAMVDMFNTEPESNDATQDTAASAE